MREGATWSTCIGGSGFFGQAEPHTSSAAWPRDGDGARHRPGRRRWRARSRLRSPPAWRPGHRRRRSWLPLGDASPRYRRADRDYAGRVARGARRPRLAGARCADPRLGSRSRVRRAGAQPHPSRPVLLRGAEQRPSRAHGQGVAVPVGSAGRSAGACGATPLQSRRARCRRCARRLSFAAQAGAITPVPRPVRNPPQYSRPQSGRPQGRRRSSA